jgi:CBS domain-containing protein
MNLTKELLSTEIPCLSPLDTGERVLSIMEEYKVAHLALVENGKYLCLVSERDAYRLEDPTIPLGKASYFAPSVDISDNLLAMLEKITSNKLSLLPMTNADNDYLGVITQPKTILALAAWLGVDKPGAILVLEVAHQDYSVSEIARIVENNNAQILNLFTYPSDTGRLRIGIKVNVEDASNIIRSFERFNFNLVQSFSKQSLRDDADEHRLQELFYYINM